MKVKTITLEGQTGFIATISREPKNILCEITDNNGIRRGIHHVSTNDRNDQLDGCKGTNSMKHDYFRIISLLAD
jgi:hypothetical protein